MPDYTYVIIGGGMAGAAAVRGIRRVDEAWLKFIPEFDFLPNGLSS